MSYKEVKYTDELWNKLYPIAIPYGSSLHCDEWRVLHEGTVYRLTWCSVDLKMIEVLE